MNSEEFEKQLKKQTIRAVPAEWRKEILRSAGTKQAIVGAPENRWWHEFLWPCPQAWAGLAGAWIVIFALHLSSPPTPRIIKSFSAETQEWVLTRQRTELTQAMGSFTAATVIVEPIAEPARPRPRTQKRPSIIAV